MLRKQSRLFSIALILTLIIGFIMPVMPVSASIQLSYDELATRAVQNNYSLFQNGRAVDGGWGNFSSYDAYILNQAGTDVASWVYDGSSFADSVIALIDQSIANEGTPGQSSSKRVAQDYLGAKSLGETAKAAQLLDLLKARQTASGNGSFDNSAFSDIPALEMLGRAGDIGEIDIAGAISYLLGEQDTSGAWTSGWQDFMTTAQAVRALKYLQPYAGGQESTVNDAISNGCDWLQARQKDNGSFQDDAFWDDPAVDTAEIVYTLKLLQIDPADWTSNGKTAPNYLQDEARNEDGTFGSSKNIASNTWVLEAYLQLGANLGLVINPESNSITVNGSKQLTATSFSPSVSVVTNTASWSVDDDTVASVNNGLVTGLKIGQTRINATFGGMAGSAVVNVASSGGGDSGQGQNQTISVNITVTGKNNSVLFGPAAVTLAPNGQYGLTPIAALNATGLSWAFSPQYDDFITQIAGQANEGMNGWMYKVNGIAPGVSAVDTVLAEGDQVIWWYSLDGGSAAAPAGAAAKDAQEIKELLSKYTVELVQLGAITSVIKSDKQMSLTRLKELQQELTQNKVDLTIEAGQAEVIIADELQEVRILVPENALSESRTLTVQELPSDAPAKQFAAKAGSSIYEFGPSGTKFEKPITISLKAAITEDIDLERLTPAWYDETKREWVPIPGIIDLEQGLVVFQIDHFTSFALIETPLRKNFSDISEDFAWAKEAVEILAGQEIIKGTGKGYEPQRSISRAEFVQLLVKALGLEQVNNSEIPFKDVDSSAWFAPAVGIAYQNNIISGYTDDTFRPLQQISRNEIAAILYKLKGSSDEILSAVELVYKDVNDVPAWALNGLKYAQQSELIKGYEDGTFKGNNSLSRAEAAVILYNYLKK